MRAGITPRQKMVINTKFNPGDTVWYMDHSTPVARKIKYIKAEEGECTSFVVYRFNAQDVRNEDEVFATKEELRDFVFGTE